MDFPVPDPVFTRSEQTRAHFRLSVKITLGFLALIWLIHLLGWALDMGPEPFGIRPRQLAGLPGIVVAPLMHGSFAHLIANSPPLLVSGTAMLFLYPHAALRAVPAIYFGAGVIVWLAGRGSVHLGASGLVYGFVSHIFVAGLLRRDRRAIAASLVVAFMYGSLAWGLLPVPLGVSWETHLAAALIGATSAIAWRHLDVPPLKRYAWETEQEEEVEEEVAAKEQGRSNAENSHPPPAEDEPDPT